MAKGVGGLRGGGNSAYNKIMGVLADIQRDGFSKQSPFSVGRVESDLRQYAEDNNIPLGNGELYMSPKQIAHTMRDLHAEKGIDISPQELAAFPRNRTHMSLYHDKNDDKFVYHDGNVKYVVQPNYKLKLPTGKERVVNFITAYSSDGSEFNQRNYVQIRKKKGHAFKHAQFIHTQSSGGISNPLLRGAKPHPPFRHRGSP